MPTATLYNLPASMVPYAVRLAGMPLTVMEARRGVIASAKVDNLAQAKRIMHAWRDGQVMANGFTTGHVSLERVEFDGLCMAL